MPLSTQGEWWTKNQTQPISCQGKTRGHGLARGTKQSDQTSLQGHNQHTWTEQENETSII